MQPMTRNTIVVTPAAFLTLTMGAFAQMGSMKETPNKGGMMKDMMKDMMGGMMGGGMMKDMMPIHTLLMSHNEITRTVQDIPGGVRTTETSKNPQVTLLIRQHARAAVSEFVKYGMPRAMQPPPLPKGYRPISGKAGSGMTSGGMMGM